MELYMSKDHYLLQSIITEHNERQNAFMKVTE